MFSREDLDATGALDLMICSCAVLIADFSTDKRRRQSLVEYLHMWTMFCLGIYTRVLGDSHHDLSETLGQTAVAELEDLIDRFDGIDRKDD